MQPIDHFFRSARACPDAVALEDGPRMLRYSELAEQVRSLACGLQAADPQPGSRVGISCSNNAEHVVALLASLAAGKVWVPLFPRHSAAEIGRIIDFTETSIVIADPETLNQVTGSNAHIIVADGQSKARDTTGGMRRTGAGCPPTTHIRAATETQAIKFTGGTTGAPKGVMQPLRAWNTNIVTGLT